MRLPEGSQLLVWVTFLCKTRGATSYDRWNLHASWSTARRHDLETSFPSDFPSDAPSLIPSDAPSIIPSELSSDEPSQNPTEIPTYVPSGSSSLHPSVVPSSIPSGRPSFWPSNPPSSSPSFLPTKQPSKAPTISPSDFPTSAPSMECQDSLLYRSPINGFLCEDHAGTDCIQWRFLGLSLDEIEDLVNNCPQSCGIDCGNLIRFDLEIQYRLSGVSTFLALSSIDTLSKTSIQVLTNYVQSQEPESHFFLDQVELKSQKMVTDDRRLRNTQEMPSSTVLITVAHRGLSIDFGQQKLVATLRAGIDDENFSKSLRQSSDPIFQFVRASTTDAVTPLSRKESDPDSSGPSSGGITGTVLLCLVMSGLATAYFVKNRKLISKNTIKKEEGNVKAQIDAELEGISPINSARSNESMTVGITSAFKRAFGVSPKHDRQHVSHIDEGCHEGSEVMKGMINEQEAAENTGSSETHWEEEQMHPFACVIPPMIVYDHIDEGEKSPRGNDESSSSDPRSKIMKPLTERRKASIDFAHSLTNTNSLLPFVFPENYDASLYRVNSESSSESVYVHENMGPQLTERSDEGNEKAAYSIDSDEDTTRQINQTQWVNTKISGLKRRNSEGNLNDDGEELFSSVRSTRSCDNIDLGYASSDSNNTSKARPTTRGISRLNFLSSPGRRRRPTTPTYPLAVPGIPPRPQRLRNEDSFGSIYMESTESGSSFHAFKVPRIGTLGLVIEDVEGGGTLITQVKSYSPLLGLAQVNDRIVSINGTDVTNFKSEDVQKLFSSRSSFRKAPPLVKLVVRREKEASDNEAESQESNGSPTKIWSWGDHEEGESEEYGTDKS